MAIGGTGMENRGKCQRDSDNATCNMTGAQLTLKDTQTHTQIQIHAGCSCESVSVFAVACVT